MLPVRRLEPRPRSLSRVPALRRAHLLRAQRDSQESIVDDAAVVALPYRCPPVLED